MGWGEGDEGKKKGSEYRMGTCQGEGIGVEYA